MSGKQIRLFLADGTIDGLITAEIGTWPGQVVSAPRSQLPGLLERAELSRTGVYFLLGDDPETVDREVIYIGEADDVGKRLNQHNRDPLKAFWQRAVVVTSTNLSLTKAHVRYLESRFVAMARAAGRATVMNGTTPTASALPEGDRSDMEHHIAEVRLIVSMLGVHAFNAAPVRRAPLHLQAQPEPLMRPPSQASPDTSPPTSTHTQPQETSAGTPPATSPTFILRQQRRNLVARARIIDGRFTVLAGSQAYANEEDATATPNAQSNSAVGYLRLRQTLLASGRLIPAAGVGQVLVFPEDTIFESASAAAAVVVGRSNANGNTYWMVEGTQQTYGAWRTHDIP